LSSVIWLPLIINMSYAPPANIGDRFGKLVIIKQAEPDIYRYAQNNKERLAKLTKWECLCDCGEIAVALQGSLRRGKKISCGCTQKAGPTNFCWRGCGEISGEQWAGFKSNATKRKLKEFFITIQYGWDLFLKQNRRCAISKIPIHFDDNNSTDNGTASLDRIDSSLGYIEGNVQWVHKSINSMKMSQNQDSFINLCKLVASHRPLKNN
jgi:hypothetical protein